MEPQAAAAGSSEPAAAPSSFQARLWKNLQLGAAKGKGGGGSGHAGGPEQRPAAPPSPSPPPPGGRRDALAGGAGGTGTRWISFKKRKQVLDRVFSSSQPNLCCSSPEHLGPGGPARGEQGSTLRRRLREHLLPAGKGPAAAGTPPGGRSPDSAPSSSSASSSLSSSPQPPPRGSRAQDEGAQHRGAAAHLCHQKSSSLPGTASLEQLLEPPPPPAAGAERAQGAREPWTLEKGSQVSAGGPGPCLQLWGTETVRRAGPWGKEASRTCLVKISLAPRLYFGQKQLYELTLKVEVLRVAK